MTHWISAKDPSVASLLCKLFIKEARSRVILGCDHSKLVGFKEPVQMCYSVFLTADEIVMGEDNLVKGSTLDILHEGASSFCKYYGLYPESTKLVFDTHGYGHKKYVSISFKTKTMLSPFAENHMHTGDMLNSTVPPSSNS